jgi:regulation of enolase protein 1 (concanavalin A-like superfamily)
MKTKFMQTKFARSICFMAVVVLTVSLTGNVFAQGEPLPTVWRDDFDGSLAADWGWMNENPGQWNLTELPGFLRIYTSDSATGSENFLLRPVAAGDFSIETRLLFTPERNYQIAGLVIWQDAENFLQLGRAFCDNPEGCVDNGIYFDQIQGGGWFDGNFATAIDNPFDPAEAYLRLERRGEMVRALYSHEGITWSEIGTHWIPPDFQVNGVGLTAAQGAAVPANFDYFELTEGWGFLPEGFHDYDGGDVPSWACNAGGWAADPDDRAADIAVEIDVDGVPLPAWLSAGEYREDLESAGVCLDGNCGFSTSLWGTISAYEPHEIVAYAQDIPSGDWVRLSNSPKALTCRTYDIYAYDPLTGETKPISNIRDADEYNPSWSPNGKKVAHDVVAGDGSQAIYITDVKTGLSAPLAGAENGNDAVWSPSGKWLAFDLGAWSETPNLYLIPASGGTPTFVRENAVSADWAPNGKRLVFQDLTDGAIRTTPVDGGQGGVTTIAASGMNPAWSPDGNLDRLRVGW